MIPTEFRYWQNINKPSVQRLRKILRFVLRFDPQLSDDVVRTWAESYFAADPVGEAAVADLYLTRGQKEGRAIVDRALRDGVDSVADVPASLRTLFAEVEHEPDWLDWSLVELGARVFRRYGTHLYSFAGAITVQGYRESSVAKPLAFTGAYSGESANRRFLETAAFWNDVAEPQALRHQGAGRAIAMRVRLMHVFVRKQLLAHPHWNLAAWGVPISQGDALITLMGGCVAPAYGLRLLGYRTSDDETIALLHFWRYVGHLMGVQPKWYPRSIAEGIGVLFSSQVRSANAAGDDGKMLAQSYLASYAPTHAHVGVTRLRKTIEHRMQCGYASLFLSRRTYEHFDLPSPGIWRAYPLLQAPWIFGRETLRRRSSRVDEWLDTRVRRQTARWVRTNLGERAAEYRAVERFTR